MFKNDSFVLLDLKTVKSMGGTYFIEITKEKYRTKISACWHEHSLYIHGDIWLNLFDVLVRETLKHYDFYAFNHLSEQEVELLAQSLLKVADLLLKCQTIDDFNQPPLLSKSNQPYIQFNNDISSLFLEKNLLEKQIKQFNEDFSKNIIHLRQIYQNLAHWLMENKKNGLSILGI